MISRPIAILLLPLAVAGWPGTLHGAAGMVVADSVWEFSDTQGASGWYYGYYDGDAPTPFRPGDFELIPQFSLGRWVIQEGEGGYWTEIGQMMQHPNGFTTSFGRVSAEHWAARRWVSDVVGTHVITGTISDIDPRPSTQFQFNGVVGHIFVDDTEVYTRALNEGGFAIYSIVVNLAVGSVVDFVVDARESYDWTDSTTFTAQVIVPEPNSGLLAVGCIMGLWTVTRRNERRRPQRKEKNGAARFS
jgi:hypothetical protein